MKQAASRSASKQAVKVKSRLYPVMIERMEEGGYYAECPVFQGCHVEGDTYAEAIENMEDAIHIFVESYRELGKPLPEVPVMEGHVVMSAAIPVAVGE